MFNLDQLAATDTTEIEIVNAQTEEPLGITVSCYTPDSSKWVNAEKKYAKAQSKQRLILGKKGEGNSIELDSEIAETRKKVILDCITGIDGIDDFEFSKANVNKMLNDQRYNWFYQQIDEGLQDRDYSFLEKSEAPAAPTSK